MKKYIMSLLLATTCLAASAQEPAHVIITAGQSNTDGRVPNTQLPPYIKALATDTTTYAQGAYRHCLAALNDATGTFAPFWPQSSAGKPLWAYDAVTYYLLEQQLGKPFYVIKWAVGGTAISPKSGKACWMADARWLAREKATSAGGRSLLRSFLNEIDACIDNTLSRLENGYHIDAFLWHQGESDEVDGEAYYDHLKTLVACVRAHLSEKTGKDYSRLPFIFGTVAHANRQYNADVEEAMWRLSREDAHMYLIDMSAGGLLDPWHFDAPSAEYLGEQVFCHLNDNNH